MLNVIFAHGLESSPQGTKSVYLRDGLNASTPALFQFDLEQQVLVLQKQLANAGQSVLVGSSLGGLAALGVATRSPELIAHLVLLAPAVGVHRRPDCFANARHTRPTLPEQARQFSAYAVPPSVAGTIIHGLMDDVVSTDDVLELTRRSPNTRLVLVQDDHSLHRCKSLILSVTRRAAEQSDPLAG